MKTARVPSNWINLHGGDFVHTKVAKHRIDEYVKKMDGRGYRMVVEESESGYWIKCVSSPHDKANRPKLRLVKG